MISYETTSIYARTQYSKSYIRSTAFYYYFTWVYAKKKNDSQKHHRSLRRTISSPEHVPIVYKVRPESHEIYVLQRYVYDTSTVTKIKLPF